MPNYQPTWRRPIVEAFRRTAQAPVQWCVRLGIHPNLVSYSSIAASTAAGLCFWRTATLGDAFDRAALGAIASKPTIAIV